MAPSTIFQLYRGTFNNISAILWHLQQYFSYIVAPSTIFQLYRGTFNNISIISWRLLTWCGLLWCLTSPSTIFQLYRGSYSHGESTYNDLLISLRGAHITSFSTFHWSAYNKSWKVSGHVFVLGGIDCATFYNFSIGFRNDSNSVVFFVFHFIRYLLDIELSTCVL